MIQEKAKPTTPAAPSAGARIAAPAASPAETRNVKVQLQNQTKQDFRVIKSLVAQGPWSPRPASKQAPDRGKISTAGSKMEWSMEGSPIGKSSLGKTEFISEIGYVSIVWRWRSNGIFDHDIRTSGTLAARTNVDGPWSKEPVLRVEISTG